VPDSGLEAKALVGEMQTLGVSKLYVADDGRLYGRALALEVTQAARSAGLTLVSSAAGADGVFYGASADSAGARASAVSRLDQDSAANPSAKLFAPSGLYDSAFASALSSGAQGRLYVSSPGFLSKDLPVAGRAFVSDFRSTYGHDPAPQAIFGYEAMSDLLDVLGKAGSSAADRAVVVSDFRGLKDPPNSVIGTYSISGGDPSIAPIIFSRVRGGQLRPFKFVQLTG
jgi:ABC-type branched-subunit amino acid transport system substrate-binding protein